MSVTPTMSSQTYVWHVYPEGVESPALQDGFMLRLPGGGMVFVTAALHEVDRLGNHSFYAKDKTLIMSHSAKGVSIEKVRLPRDPRH